METTNPLPKFRRFQAGAIASLVLAVLCIFAPIAPEMSNALKWTYIVSGFFVVFAMIHLFPGTMKMVAFIFFGLGYFCALFFINFENELAVNIAWLVLLFFTSGAFSFFYRDVPPTAVFGPEPPMPRSWSILKILYNISFLLFCVMLIAVIAKTDIVNTNSITNICKIVILIIYFVEFLLARDTLIKVIELERVNK